MTVAALFPSQDAVLDIAVPDKAALFALLSAEASERLNHPAADILEALEEREELGSTALGRGVALPHSRLSWLPAPFALLARLRQPIDFDARDGEPVDLVFWCFGLTPIQKALSRRYPRSVVRCGPSVCCVSCVRPGRLRRRSPSFKPPTTPPSVQSEARCGVTLRLHPRSAGHSFR